MFELSSNDAASNTRLKITEKELANIVKTAVRDEMMDIINDDLYNHYSDRILNIDNDIVNYYLDDQYPSQERSNKKNLRLIKGNSNLKAA